MPKKQPLPAHLEALLTTLEGQEGAPDRLAALDAAEAVAGKRILLEDALRNPEFRLRYKRWLERQKIAMQDAQVGRVKAGKASAAPVIASFDEFQPAETRPSNNGRPVLGRQQTSRAASDRW